MSAPTAYRVVHPATWQQIPLGSGAEAAIYEIVAQAVAQVPNGVPPDQVQPARRALERTLLAQVRAARDRGGIDLYLPVDTWHGFLAGMTFIVSEATPYASVTEDSHVGAVLAALVSAGDGATLVTIDDTVWVRLQGVERRPAPIGDGQVDAVRVTYTTAVPGEPRRWIIASMGSVGDGDPASDLSRLFVELFDAVMSTWRWLVPSEAAGD